MLIFVRSRRNMPSETENNIFKIQLYPKGSKGQASNRQTPYSLNKHDVNEICIHYTMV